jgi:L,D-transpeptidase catalytic domain
MCGRSRLRVPGQAATRALLAAACTGILLAAPSVSAAAAGAVRTAPVPVVAQPGDSTAPLAAAPRPASATPAPVADVALSDERTVTTWAHPVTVLPIYARPDVHAREITHTRLFTEDGFPEVYLLLATRADARGHTWVRMRVPGRPNGRTGWVLREALGGFHRTAWRVRINLALRRLTVYFDGHRRFAYPVGVGKPSTPTPTGHFWVRELFRLTSRSSPYWPWAIGTSAYSILTDWPGGGIVGIHGDFGEPQRIPGDPSHGCVRMRNADLARMAPHITLGTPVEIV